MEMTDFLIQILVCVIMAVSLVCTRYVVPLLKNSIGAKTLDKVTVWVEKVVLYAQQVLTSSTGAEKKATATSLLKEILTVNHITISDEQLDILIEAAVKSMKISEASGEITITNNTTAED